MGISVTKLLIVLAIILVLFGTKRLRSVGSDLGDAIRNFRLALKEGENEPSDKKEDDSVTEELPSEDIKKK